MPFSDSMFLFEIDIKSLQSYVTEKEITMNVEFTEVFNMALDKPTNISYQTRLKQKCKVRKSKIAKKQSDKSQTTQSVIVTIKPSFLLSCMQKYPLKLVVKANKGVYGSVVIPWKEAFIDYVGDISNKNTKISLPPYSIGSYNVYDKTNSKRFFAIEMGTKLTYIENSTACCQRNKFLEFAVTENPRPLHRAFSSESCIGKKNLTTAFIQSESRFKIKKSDVQLSDNGKKEISRVQSCTATYVKMNSPLKYIFGDPLGVYGNQVYCVGFFSVDKNASHPNSPKSDDNNLKRTNQEKKKFKFKKCDIECKGKRTLDSTSNSACSLNLDEAAQISITKCKEIDCSNRNHRKLTQQPGDSTFLNLMNVRKDCCVASKTEEIVGGVKAKMKFGKDPCLCTCECTFGFTKKTTYCNVCGGYELAGDDLMQTPVHDLPIPCPLYHKMIDKSKLRTYSTSGSESKKKADEQKNLKTSSSQKAAISDKNLNVTEKKSVESEKDSKKSKKKKVDERFKFNYGYKGIPPQIGHSKCALPCSGTLDNVPKSMGWLWTAENVPGMKFRPMWKPGATSKHVVRLLKIAKNPGEMISKKKRKDTSKKKRPIKRPLLIVHKKHGEFTVTMETMKKYSKPRALNQQPYDDKPVVTYTIGRTEEENRDRLKKKERERRRLERAQRQFIQSTFKDMCQEICLKTYEQALGILPGAEDPKCICCPAIPTPKTTNMDVSCSCSEDSASIGSDTDSDEWIVEFTPPNALFDPSYKGKKLIKVDNSTQYTYLDYRVKLIDRFGNPVPRFFKDLDGKQQCSDLGGFWSPDHKWLEINVDGYIAPDSRWAPNIFTGPNGEQVDAEIGKFQAMNGKWLIVGVDGYIDSQGKWKFYSRTAGSLFKKKRPSNDIKKAKPREKKCDKSETSWSCLGDVSPKQLSKLGIVGHGEDRKLLMSTLQDMLAHGEDVNIPQPKTVFHLPSSKKVKNDKKYRIHHDVRVTDSDKCHHAPPSEKGILAVDGYGNKIYFKLRKRKNRRPKERLANIADQGISLSSFHVPCFNSFINSEVMKQQQRQRLLALAGKNTATQVHKDWKPGAVSKRLLRMLKQAKLRKSTVEEIKRTKRSKKIIEDKPTLVVSKQNGRYHIEMQVTPDNLENTDQCTPLIYDVTSLNTDAKLRKKEKLQRRLTREAANEILSDPYNPEACEKKCLRFYKKTVGDMSLKRDYWLDQEETIHSCSCGDEEISSSCSSSEVDWEIQFTPPSMRYVLPLTDKA